MSRCLSMTTAHIFLNAQKIPEMKLLGDRKLLFDGQTKPLEKYQYTFLHRYHVFDCQLLSR
jgi:hypothetical protein